MDKTVTRTAKGTEAHADAPFNEFLARFVERVSHVFGQRAQGDAFGLHRGLPPYVLNEILAAGPALCSIPHEYGGRGARPLEILSMLEAAAYESLPFSLMLGINGALFLEPLAKYGRPELKRRVFDRFVTDNVLGGLMITEPEYGTDALSMRTAFTLDETGYRVQGVKHWAGLSGWADFWLVTAREQRPDGGLHRDIGFFVCDSDRPEELIRVEEYYPNLGLHMIPYGRNRIDVRLPDSARLEPHTNGLRMLQDLLHRSRMRFAGMAAGFLKRLSEEAGRHCRERSVGGRLLVAYDQVLRRLAELQAGQSIAAAFCKHAAECSGIEHDLSSEGLAANVHKSVLSDLMQAGAQSLLQLCGAQGYRQDRAAGRAFVDSRPFQIFEGSNDVIYHQIASAFLKAMEGFREFRLSAALKLHALTARAASHVAALLDFKVEAGAPQRRQVDLGRILGRVVAIDFLLRLAESGYDSTRIENAILVLKEKIAALAAGLGNSHPALWVNEGNCETNWQNCLRQNT